MTRVEDRLKIADKLHLYTHAIDRRRWDLMPKIFHDKAIFLFGEVEGDWRGFIEQAKAIIHPMISTHHQLGNTLYNFDDDVAHCESYLTATHILPADYPVDMPFPGIGRRYVVTVGARYIDRFEKQNDEWWLKSRNGVFDWRQDTELNDGGLIDGPQDALGQTDESDPSTIVTSKWRN